MLDAIVDLTLDLGPDFKVTGSGLDARVEGKLHLTSAADAPLSAHGEISLVHGTYEAYGRKLEIDKGTLYFTGPLDNPGLNIRAMRKKQQVEAGVEISGTARAPRVTLVSTPDVPDTEKLSWLVLGRKVDANNHNDAQALQSAAALLLADVGTSPLQKKLAKGLGLDEIGIAASDTSTPGSTRNTAGTGGVVTLGKRLSERMYVMFEARAGRRRQRDQGQLSAFAALVAAHRERSHRSAGFVLFVLLGLKRAAAVRVTCDATGREPCACSNISGTGSAPCIWC